jgi:hypothetical protein
LNKEGADKPRRINNSLGAVRKTEQNITTIIEKTRLQFGVLILVLKNRQGARRESQNICRNDKVSEDIADVCTTADLKLEAVRPRSRSCRL